MNGARCYSCGEYDVIEVPHRHPVADWDGDFDSVPTHPWCRNCDWGLCGDCENGTDADWLAGLRANRDHAWKGVRAAVLTWLGRDAERDDVTPDEIRAALTEIDWLYPHERTDLADDVILAFGIYEDRMAQVDDFTGNRR